MNASLAARLETHVLAAPPEGDPPRGACYRLTPVAGPAHAPESGEEEASVPEADGG